MTIHIRDCQAERLSNDRLMTLLMEVANEARRRPALTPALKQWHSEELEELKLEDLCRAGACADIEPEAMLQMAHVPVEPRPISRDTLRLVGGL